MNALQWITHMDIPGDLRAAHAEAWQCGARDWEIYTYSLPAHPLTDAIDAALGIRGVGIACRYARLHQDNDPCWRGLRFVSLVITGNHWIDVADTRPHDGCGQSMDAIPGVAFVLRPQSWHCAFARGDKLLRLAQWEIPARKVPAAVKVFQRMAQP